MNAKQLKKNAKDDKWLESAFRIEVFFKKYYRVILGVVVLVIGYAVWAWVSDYQEEQRAMRITEIFTQIQNDGLSKELLEKIKKEGGEAYDFVALGWAIKESKVEELEKLKNSSNSFVAQYAGYEFGSMKQNFETGKKYGEFQNLIFLQEGYQLISEKKYKEASEKFNAIDITSPLKEWALRIGHYGIGF